MSALGAGGPPERSLDDGGFAGEGARIDVGSERPSVPQSESELEQLFDLSRDLLCIAGFDGYFKLVNPAFERTLGYSRPELLSRPFLDLVHPDDVQSSRDVVAYLSQGNDVIGYEHRIVCADGSVRWLQWNTRTMAERGFVYGVARDVTERRRADAELREAHVTVEASRDELRALAEEQARLAKEQAALRRVATLVARGVPPEELFTAVTEEVGQLLSVELAGMGHYESDGTVTSLAVWGRGTGHTGRPVGSRWTLEGENVVTVVARTGRPTRTEDADASGPLGVTSREMGIRSTVGTPIIVEGRLWGMMGVASTRDQPLPADTEARLASFTELVATAIANAESRGDLARLGEEQAALRRVATLVARGVPAEELFAAVTEEVGQVLPVEAAGMGRYESDATITALAVSSGAGDTFPPVGIRWPLEGENVATVVAQTGRPARTEYADASGQLGVAARELGIRSAVGTPIIVEDGLWGVMVVHTTQEQSLPPDTEARLVSFTELLATAIANAESRAELAASRARIVAAGDETRRRIERDLHDGAQQQLVTLGLELRAAQAAVPPELGELDGELSRVAERLTSIQDELREMARGIHPAILADGGLRPALKTLARRSPIPVELDMRAEARLPEQVEVATYYVVSETLTNAAKHARASVVHVEAEAVDGVLRLRVQDDGAGGADPKRGSGLVGLKDRVESLGGTITVQSKLGEGTSVQVELPLSD